MPGTGNIVLNDWIIPSEPGVPSFSDAPNSEPTQTAPPPPPKQASNRHENTYKPQKPAFDLSSILPLLGKDLGPLAGLLKDGKPDISSLLPLLLQNMNNPNGNRQQKNQGIGKTVNLDEYTRVN